MSLLYPPPNHGSRSKEAQVLRVLCEECFATCMFLFFFPFFSSSSQLGRDYHFSLSCLALGSALSSLFLLIEGELLKWGSVYKQNINGGFSPSICVSGYDLKDLSMFPGNMK